ncbi:phosphate ABC transporter substrate-binding protein [Bermanella sp. R86510]|uniref:phosphate ABC transporter substrate-binding protein n=1 Tax=unclassified Bermanella TaxID=2627862 RepID=UPI0037C87245
MKLSIKLLSTLALAASVSLTHAGAVVVAGAGSPLPASGSDDVVKVFLGKKKDLGGVSVVPIDQTEGNPARGDFYSNVVGRTEAQLKSYWSRLIFTGKGQAPQDVGGDADVKSMVGANPNLVGYIDESAVDGSVKVIFKP